MPVTSACSCAQGVQIVRPMRVGHALGRAGRARREAQAAGRGLVEAAPFDWFESAATPSPRRATERSPAAAARASAGPSITRTWSIDGAASQNLARQAARDRRSRSGCAPRIARAYRASCAARRRGLRVWHTAPMPMIAYQVSRCACVFQARVATRSPCDTPSCASAAETGARAPAGRIADPVDHAVSRAR